MSNPQPVWPTSPTIPPLHDHDIHVWFTSLHADDEAAVRELRSWLTTREREKAGRFLFERHRQRFIIGRARLRQLLGLYRGQPPETIEFQYDGLGKPSFRGSINGEGLCFNFTNSDEGAMLAVANNVELGVDIEKLRPLTNLEGLAARFFTTAETEQILAERGDLQRQLFFRCWTRKEAYLKAVGKGLTFPLNRVQVSIVAHQPAHIISINNEAKLAADWQLHHLQPLDGYFGALAYSGRHSQLKLLHWAG